MEQSGIEIVTNMPKNSATAYKSITDTTIKKLWDTAQQI